ncbi:hypothetical protein C2G38_2169790 [Gigaspora rosea]|uniref:Uncharacterized protein n=1 Tax=Gigaspora rosea TaxID=44941 RepID=A0A397VY80_9GLOM|nr:hypothetical protein C2G38_2169790 [Gigaspora rosea]
MKYSIILKDREVRVEEDKIEVEKDATKLTEVVVPNEASIKNQALPYHQNPVEAINHTKEVDDINKQKWIRRKKQ